MKGGLLLIMVILLTPSVQGSTADGFLEAAPPVQLEGSIDAQVLDPTLHVRNPDLGIPASPLVFSAEDVRIVHELLETQTYKATVSDRTISLDGPETTRDTTYLTAENATIEISLIGGDADIVFAPAASAALGASVAGADQAAMVTVDRNVTVLDGYRKAWGELAEGFPKDFEYTYTRSGPLVNVTDLSHLALRGGAHGYVWDAQVRIHNETGVLASFETGRTTEHELGGAKQTDRYEYLTFELDGVEADLQPGGLEPSIFTPGLRLALDGQAMLPGAVGSFHVGEEVYRAEGGQGVSMSGNLSLAFTPVLSGTEGRLSVGLGGQAEDISLLALPSTSSPFVENLAIVGAGGATVVGLAAAWYVLSLKGASVAAILARPTREKDEEEATHGAAVEVQRPGDLLMDTDRFTLYHLIKAQVGLSAEECQRRTGIEDADVHLETLAQHNLLVPMAEGPRRYCLPGMVQEARARRIAMLRDDQAFQVASVLAIHGLMPVSMLLERASKAHPGLDPITTRRTLERLLHQGLAMREEGREGPVVDAAPELYECLKLMGERALVPDL